MNISFFKLFIMIAAVLFAGGCGKSHNDPARAEASPAELALPDVPPSLTDPAARADYLVTHFWDKMNFGDRSLSLDTAFMEQSFSNFISVMPLGSADARTRGANALLDGASGAGDDVYRYVCSIAEHYLWEPESPFFSEDLYLPFVEYALRYSGGDDPLAAGRRDDIMCNRPGSAAPAFRIEGRDGRPVDLRDHGPRTATLLMFYEPDCELCNSAIELLASSETLAAAISDGSLRMVLVYLGSDRAMWAAHAAKFPGGWLAGIDSEGTVDDNELYLVRATPSFYLIDPTDRIVLKDAAAATVAAALGL